MIFVQRFLYIVVLLLIVWCIYPWKNTQEVNKDKGVIIMSNSDPLEEEKRKKQEIQNKKIDAEEYAVYQELLGDTLIDRTKQVNKSALELLWKRRDNPSAEFDLLTDNSLTRYVNNIISFDNKQYIPSDLQSLTGAYIVDKKRNGKLQKEALLNLQALSENYYLEFNTPIIVVSSYRSYEYQKKIKEGGCSDVFCAKAWFSEHQSWLAIDLWEASTKKDFLGQQDLKEYFEWMNENAFKYGFINTYKKGIKIDGYDEEPWHWRYVGVDLSFFLQKNKLSFAEFNTFMN